MQTRGWWCDEHQRYECTSPRKHGRGTCHGSLVGDSDRCRMHLGRKAGPAILDARLNARAAAELAQLDVPPVLDPFTELSKLAGQAVAWKDQMAQRVNQLDSLRYESAHGLEQLRSEILLWERAMDRCVATLTAMARLNIDERLVGIRQQTADMLERAFVAALGEAGLDLDGQMRARKAFSRRLRVLSAATEPEPGPQAITTVRPPVDPG